MEPAPDVEPSALGAGGRAGASRRWLVPVLLVAALAASVGGVVAIRESDLIPLPRPPDLEPAPGLLDPGGVDRIRLGMSYREFLRQDCPDGCGDTAWPLARDEVHNCTRYPFEVADPASAGWVWLRDGEVVAVGIAPPAEQAPDGAAASAGTAGATTTWTGLSVGAALSPVPDELDRWDQDAEAPVPVLRREHGGITTTLADTTGDGRLDYASVATAEGQRCRYDPAAEGFSGFTLPDEAELMVDGVLDGLALGMPVDAASPPAGWEAGPVPAEAPDGAECRVWVNPWGVAFVRETVVGFRTAGIRGGPAIGMTQTEAEHVLDDVVTLPLTTDDEAFWDDGSIIGRLTGTDDRGTRVTLTTHQPPGSVAGLAVPIAAPIAGSPPVVISIAVGEDCLPA